MKHRNLFLLPLFLFACVFSVNAGATYTVNSAAIGDTCDGVLTLDEAAYFAANDWTPTGRGFTPGEKAQIQADGWIGGAPCGAFPVTYTPLNSGSDFADDIIFTNAVGTINGVRITLGPNDDINGLRPDGTRVILDGAGTSSNSRAISMRDNSGSQIRNLRIRNYNGFAIFGQALSGAIFEGLEISNNSTAGLSFGFSSSAGRNSRNVRIGGSQPQHRNVIFGNGTGIALGGSSSQDRSNQNIRIENNFIGTSDGVSDNGNSSDGINIQDTIGVTIGDPTGATRNVISGNNGDGIEIFGTKAVSTLIVNNYIGVNSSGTSPLGNTGHGVAFRNGAGFNDNIGGAPNELGRPGLGNVISTNTSGGVLLSDSQTSMNIIKANKIGTNLGGNQDLGNFGPGISIGAGAQNNEIGGTLSTESNELAYNSVGVSHNGSNGNIIRRNSIYGNDGLGIDLAANGFTPNDNQDTDSGPNNLQNYPIITFVRALSSSTLVQGTLNSTPNRTFTISIYGNTSADASGMGEGRTWLANVQVTTNASGNATFSTTITVSLSSVGQWVSSTATDQFGNTSEFSNARNICSTPVASPDWYQAPVSGASSSFTFINSTGCGTPSVASNRSWITGVGYLAGTVNFTVAANPAPARDGAVVVTYNNGTGTATLNFGVYQNNGCMYGLTSSRMTRPWIQTINNQFNVTASDEACTWMATSNAPTWLQLTSVDGVGNGSVVFTSTGNGSIPRIGTITVGQMTFTVYQTSRPTQFDFTGDAKTDIGIHRPNGAMGSEWWIKDSTTGQVTAIGAGQATDVPVPADFTGDQKADVAYWTPSSGVWSILRSENFTYTTITLGASGDIPAPADYDGDFRADAAVFRQSTGMWYISPSTGGSWQYGLGAAGDKPVPADYDRDGRADMAVYRPSNGQWMAQRSTDGYTSVKFGLSTDKPVPGDYTGDLRADFAFYRPSTGQWFIRDSETLMSADFYWGTSGDVPASGDYDGDGIFDAAVFRPSTQKWYMRTIPSSPVVQFGLSTDRPIPNVFIP